MSPPAPNHSLPSAFQTVAVARHAMATRFEIVLHGADPVSLRAAGEEALDEVERLENQLSLYRPTSEIAHINARAAHESVRVEPGLFQLLQRARQLHGETGGAFDITIGPLMRCWGFMGGRGAVPRAADLAEARARTGMRLVRLDPENFSVRFAREGVMLDLGAIGKGHAIECAANRLREAGVESALLHGGTSTIYAIGAPPGAEAWSVAIGYPEENASEKSRPSPVLAIVPLKNEALSVSAIWGKSFQSADKTYGHIIDPRTGRAVSRGLLGAVALGSATDTDAFSTALLTVGIQGHDELAGIRPDMRTLVLEAAGGKRRFRCRARGIAVRDLPDLEQT